MMGPYCMLLGSDKYQFSGSLEWVRVFVSVVQSAKEKTFRTVLYEEINNIDLFVVWETFFLVVCDLGVVRVWFSCQ